MFDVKNFKFFYPDDLIDDLIIGEPANKPPLGESFPDPKTRKEIYMAIAAGMEVSAPMVNRVTIAEEDLTLVEDHGTYLASISLDSEFSAIYIHVTVDGNDAIPEDSVEDLADGTYYFSLAPDSLDILSTTDPGKAVHVVVTQEVPSYPQPRTMEEYFWAKEAGITVDSSISFTPKTLREKYLAMILGEGNEEQPAPTPGGNAQEVG